MRLCLQNFLHTLRLLLAVGALLYTNIVYAQRGPQNLNVSGILYLPSGAAVTQGSVNFHLQIWNKNSTCMLYAEDHLAQDLSNTKGAFDLSLGKGSGATNYLESSAVLSGKVFENTGVIAGGWLNCASGANLASGEERVIRVAYDLGGGYVTMAPDVPIASSAYAMVSETLQGKTPSNFVQVRDDITYDLNQTNVENVFSAVNYARLQQLLSPSAAVGFAGQRLTNISNPSGAQDAATKNYADTSLGGQTIDLVDVAPGAGNGKVLTWDSSANKWVALAPSTMGAAGGDLTGNFPNPSIAALAVGTSKIANNAVTSAKINNVGVATNRLLITDATTGATVNYAACANNEVLKFVTGTGWTCATVSSLSAVTSVAGKSGAVTLNAMDIGGLGTAALYNVGIGSTQIPVLDGGAKLAVSTIPGFSGDITGAFANAFVAGLQGRSIASTAPNPNEVLKWNGSRWEPSLLTDNGITALTGDISAAGNGSVAATLTNGVVTTPKLFTNPGANRLIATDAGSGATLVPFTCGLDETMQWKGTGWTCVTAAALVGTGMIANNGNSITAPVTVGTNDNFALNFETNNSTRVTITAAGNVGIGTTSPNRALEISGAVRVGPSALPSSPAAGDLVFDVAAANALKFHNGAGWQTVGTGNGNGDILSNGTVPMTGAFRAATGSANTPGLTFNGDIANGAFAPSTNNFALATSGTERLRILANGDLGIGTSTPGAKLDVNGSALIGGQLSTVGNVYLGNANGNYAEISTANTGVNHIGLYSGGTPIMYLPTGSSPLGGNVGIGTTAPARRLEVAGAIRLQPAVLPGSPAAGDLAFDSGAGNVLKFHNGNNWQTVGTGGGTGDFLANGTVPMTGNLRLNNQFLSGDGGSEGLFVDASGNVGVGKSNPSVQFDVVGSMTASGSLNLGSTGTSGGISMRTSSGNVGGYLFAYPSELQLASGVGNNPIVFYTNNGSTTAERARFSGAGALGIGTTSPNRLLEVAGPMRLASGALPSSPTAGDLAFDSAAGNSLKFHNGTSWQTISSGTGSQWTTAGSNINYMAGNVGIGTTSPSTPLSVESASGAAGFFKSTGASGFALYAQSNGASSVGISTEGSYQGIRAFGNGATGEAVYAYAAAALNTSSALRTQNTSATGYGIYAEGASPNYFESKIGIGTSTPNRLLQVAGPIRISPTALPGSPAAGDLAFDSGAGNSLKYHNGANWVAIGNGSGDFMANGSVPMSGNLRLGNNWLSGDGDGEGVFVAAGGNVGIGNTNPGERLTVTGHISADRLFPNAGTAQYPSLTVYASGGIAAGVFSPAANTMGVTTNSLERMRIDAAGNVGIGTTSPNRLLEIAGPIRVTPAILPASPAAGDLAFDSAAANSLKFYNGSAWQTVGTGTGSGDFKADGSVAMTGALRALAGNAGTPGMTFNGDTANGIFAPLTNNLAIGTSGQERLRILANGNVGIGTTSPTATLHVSTVGTFGISASNSNATGAALYANASGANSFGLEAYGGIYGVRAWAGSANGVGIAAYQPVGSNTGKGVYSLNNSATGWSIYAEGASPSYFGSNVGIGTTSPARLLQVAGPIRLGPGVLPGSPTAGDLAFDSGAGNSLKYHNGANWVAVGNGSGDFMASGSVPMSGNLRLGNNWLTGDGDNEGVFVAGGGNVGIGTTSPAATLDIAQTWNDGATTFTGLKANFTNTASSSGSKIIDIQVGGASKFWLNSTGDAVRFPGAGVSMDGATIYGSSMNLGWPGAPGWGNLASINMAASGILGYGNGTTIDTGLSRGAANKLYIGNGTAGNFTGILIAGSVGVGTTAPIRLFEVAGPIRMAPAALPSSPVAGDLAFDSGAGNTLKFHNGSTWQTVGTGAGFGDFLAGGSVPMTGNLQLNGNFLSGDGGSEGVYVNAAGFVGIGNTNPATNLDVTGVIQATSSIKAGYGTNANPGFAFNSDLDTGLFRAAVDTVAVTTGGAERMRVDNNGNLGIGTTNPLRLLQVAGPIRVSPAALPISPAAGDLAFDSGASNALKYHNGVSWQTVGTGTGSGDFLANGTVPATGNLRLNNNYLSGDGGNEGLFVDSAGYVGIGTTAPTAKLDISSISTATSGNVDQLKTSANLYPTADTNASYNGLLISQTANTGYNYTTGVNGIHAEARHNGPGTMTAARGISAFANEMYSSGTTTELTGVYSASYNQGTGGNVFGVKNYLRSFGPSSAEMTGVYSEIYTNSGTVGAAYGSRNWIHTNGGASFTDAYGEYLQAPSNAGGGTIGSYYGIFIETPTAATKNFSLFSQGGTNYFGGSVGIGTTAPGRTLEVNGGIYSHGANFEFDDGGVPDSTGVRLFSNSGYLYLQNGNGGGVAIRGKTAATNMVILDNGTVGIGVTAPNRILEVAGPMRLNPATLPTSPAAGDLAIDSGAANSLKYHNGTNWISLAVGGTGDFKADGSVAMTGAFRATGGTFAAPGITFAGDTDTGISAAVADTMILGTAGNERMRIQPNGNIGIGTTSATSALTVSSAAASSPALYAIGLGTSSTGVSGYGTSVGVYGLSATGYGVYAQGNTASVYGVNNTGGGIAVRADHLGSGFGFYSAQGVNYFGGNVGIGTTSPNAKLEVKGVSHGSEIFRAMDYAMSGHRTSIYSGESGSNVEGFYDTNMTFRLGYNSLPGGGMKFEYGARNSSNSDPTYPTSLEFSPRGQAGVITSLFMNKLGNVGIGTTSPARMLEVAGAVRLKPDVLPGSPAAGDIAIDSGAANSLKYHNGSDWVTVANAAGNIWQLNGSMPFYLGGNVGIGTTNPAAMLHVSGGGIPYSAIAGTSALFNSDTLNVNGWSNISVASGQYGTSSLYLGNTTSQAAGELSYDGVVGKMYVQNNVGTPTRITLYNGSVGIGTTSPANKLDVYDAVDALASIHTSSSTSGIARLAIYSNDQAGANSSALFLTADSSNAGGAGHVNMYTDRPLLLMTQNFPRVRVANGSDGGGVSIGSYAPTSQVPPANGLIVSGNVGIGLSAPTRLLHVAGPMRIASSALPGSPETGDIAMDSNAANTLKYYNGSSWVTAGFAAGGPSLSGLVAAVGTNTIANGSHAQTWTWDTLTTQTGMALTSTSMTTGSILNLANTNNSVGSTGSVLKIDQTGANNNSAGLRIIHAGKEAASTGAKIEMTSTDALGTSPGLQVANAMGAGFGADILMSNNGATNPTGLRVTNLATGASAYGINIDMQNSSNTGTGLKISNAGDGEGLRSSTSTGTAGYFHSNSGYGLIVNQGRAGFGTAAPHSAVEVVQTSAPDSISGLAVRGSQAGTTLSLANSGVGGTTWWMDSTHNGADFGGGKLVFGYGTSLTSYNMVMTPDGNVGIGTSTPSRQLDVAGPIRIEPSALPGSPTAGDLAFDSGASNTLKYYNGSGWVSAGGQSSANSLQLANGVVVQSEAVYGDDIVVNAPAGNKALVMRLVSSGSSQGAYINVQGYSGSGSNLSGTVGFDSGEMRIGTYFGPYPVTLETAGTKRMTIDGTNGNIGIGSSNNAARLAVVGSSTTDPSARIINNASAGYFPVLETLAPNMTAGQESAIYLGQSAANANGGGMSYIHQGNGPGNYNRLALGMYGQSVKAISIVDMGGQPNVGIGFVGSQIPGSMFAVNGGASFGANYRSIAAPLGGLIVEGNVGIGTTTAGSKLTVEGTVESTSGGFKFPDASTQTSAGTLIVVDEKSSGTAGGTCTAGAYRTRDLNTTRANTITGASLGSNQITLPAGTYEIDASAPSFVTDWHKAKLRNVSDGTDTVIGTTEYNNDIDTQTRSHVVGYFTIASPKVFELQHRCQTTNTLDGFGIGAGFGDAEVYSTVTIRKK